MAGTQHRFIGPVDDELKCGVCLDVLDDPVTVNGCGHTFCRPCIASLR